MNLKHLRRNSAKHALSFGVEPPSESWMSNAAWTQLPSRQVFHAAVVASPDDFC